MPKVKTHQATAKRFQIKKSGKIIKRADGQDHFNARESGRAGRNKKSDNTTGMFRKTITRAMPNA